MVPDAVQEAVEVPLVLRGDGAVVGDAVDDVQLLDGDLVNLVHDVDAGHVHLWEGNPYLNLPIFLFFAEF